MIRVFGENGQLAKAIIKELNAVNLMYVAYPHSELNRLVNDVSRNDYVINCTAYTNVDKAEDDIEELYKANVSNVAKLHHTGCKLIHFSSDYVFDGTKVEPYTEDDLCHPINNYGASKLSADQLLKGRAMIFRVSWLFSTSLSDNNFVTKMRQLMQVNESIKVVNDQIGCPTYVGDLASFIVKEVIEEDRYMPELFNFCNYEPTTWYQFAEVIRDYYILNCNIVPCTSDEFPTVVKRPIYSILNVNKLKMFYNYSPRSWREIFK